MTNVVTSDQDITVVVLEDDRQVLVEEGKYEVVETKNETTIITSDEVVTVIEIEQDEVVLTTDAEQGPPGRPGASATGGVFILDVTATTGIVGSKTYKPGNVPATAVLDTAASDTPTVRVWVGANGGSEKYSPDITVNDLPVILNETTTKRWFTGYADITLDEGVTIVRAKVGAAEDTAEITLAGAGPDVTAVTFGAYPGTQTALKAGDVISVTIQTDPDAVEVVITGGSVTSSKTVTVVGGSATTTLVIGVGSTGSISVAAKNVLGTLGAAFVSPVLTLDQTYPTFGTAVSTYPAPQTALKAAEGVYIDVPVFGASAVAYDGVGLLIPSPNTYEATKYVEHALTGTTTASYSLVAVRAANGAVANKAVPVYIATDAPTAAISIAGNPARLISSPVGIDYEVRITPTQPLLSAPTLNASIGAWQGAWVFSGSYWKRSLRISDGDARGPGVFSALSMTGSANIAGSTITSGANYTVGGFTSRTLTFAAFSRVAALGTTVANATKLSAQIAGGSVLALRTDNANVQGGFYPANADGTYNASGAYIGLSDAAFAGANTSGTLQLTVAETV